MTSETGWLRGATRAGALAGIAVAGLVTLVGSGGGISLGFPPCTETWCNGPPDPEASVDPPYVTLQVGHTVTFTANTVNFTGELRYAWYRSTNGGQSFTELPGATGRTLTLPAVNLADDQTIYRVKVAQQDATLPRYAAARLTVSSAPGIVFQDGDFDPADWAATVRVDPPGTVPVTSDAREPVGGNPGAWRTMTYQIPPGTGSVAVLYLHRNMLYDPAVHGPIYVIDFAEDCRMLRASDIQSAQTRLILEQGGRRFAASSDTYCTTTTWSPGTSRSSLKASDFTLIEGPACGAGTACPDYSPGAAPLRLGFQRWAHGAAGDVIGHGIDNWKVTVWRR